MSLEMASSELVSDPASNLWVIENFSGYSQRGNFVESWKFYPSNAVELDSSHRFSICVYPQGYRNQPQGIADGAFFMLRMAKPKPSHQAGSDEVTVQLKLTFIGEGQSEKLVKGMYIH